MLPGRLEIEDDKGETVVPAQRDGCCIHYFKVLRQHLGITYFFVHDRIGIPDRISIIDAIHLGRLQDDIGLDLDGPQGRRRIGRKIGISRSRREDHDPSLFQMADRPSLDERFGNLLHLDGRLNAGHDAAVFEGALEGQAVDHGGQHPHVIGGGPVHTAGAGFDPAEDVPAADNDAELNAEVDDAPGSRRQSHRPPPDRCRRNSFP